MDFEGKTVVVVGASSGIGERVCVDLVKKGAQVHAWSRHPHPDFEKMGVHFEKSVCEKALALKTSGLDWTPHAGCFVWDPAGKVGVPSPFPGNVYFILNLNHFLRIFGSVDSMKEHLVWLPTHHQCILIIERMRGKRGLEPFEKIPRDLDDLYDIALSFFGK